MINAPIHDLLIRIKNAYLARRKVVDGVVYSTFKGKVLDLLKKFKFIQEYEVMSEGNKRTARITLRYSGVRHEDIPVINFYSKPSKRWYVSKDNLPTIAAGRGIALVSTSHGLMAAHEAKKLGLGGELIAAIY
jgi:small subunit ribosomal protein S8